MATTINFQKKVRKKVEEVNNNESLVCDIHGKSMATTNDEFTETALQRFSKTEKRFGFKMTRTFDSKEKLKRGKKCISFHNALAKKSKKN